MPARHVTVHPSGWLQCQNTEQRIANLIMRGGGVSASGGGTISLARNITALAHDGNDSSSIHGELRLATPSAGDTHQLNVETNAGLMIWADVSQGNLYAGLQKLGGGELGLAGSNSFDANFTISAGRVYAASVAPFGTAKGGTLVEAGASLRTLEPVEIGCGRACG